MLKKKVILAGLVLTLSLSLFRADAADKVPNSFLDLIKENILEKHKETKEEEVKIEELELPKEEKVYTTTYLNVREAPDANSARLGVLNPNTELVKLEFNDVENWIKIKLNEGEYYVHNDYVTAAIPENIVTISSLEEIKVVEPQPVQQATNNYSTSYDITHTQPMESIAGTSAKEIIAWRESRGDYNAISSTGRYVGRYQLTNTMLNGDYSPENQERVADAYVQQRYGSWDAALAFHNSHGWY